MSDRALKWYFGTVLVGLVLAALFAYRPSLVLGVNGEVLSAALNGSSLTSASPCEPQSDGVWRCVVKMSEDGSSDVSSHPYRVVVDGWGCWEADRLRGAATGSRTPATLSGCITVLDH